MLSHIDFSKSLPEKIVNIKEKKRSNLFSWRGQFSPQLIEQLLLHYSSVDDKVFDPFLGSGTVLYERALLNLSAYGCEINPAALALSKIYELCNANKGSIEKATNSIDNFVFSYSSNGTLFGVNGADQFESSIIDFYSKSEDEIEKMIIRALIIGMDFKQSRTDEGKIFTGWQTLKNKIQNLPHTTKSIGCSQLDARRTGLNDNSIDFVVTSPPYINVFNYHQNYRKSAELMGNDLLLVAKSEIGANRKFRQNRFLTVVQYCMDMLQVFIELKRVCKPDARIIFIVGRESNVRKTPFRNAELITQVAKLAGMPLKGSQHRVFTNRFGVSIYEDILRFSSEDDPALNPIESARRIGQDALKAALKFCSDNVITDIRKALEASDNVETSPICSI